MFSTVWNLASRILKYVNVELITVYFDFGGARGRGMEVSMGSVVVSIVASNLKTLFGREKEMSRLSTMS